MKKYITSDKVGEFCQAMSNLGIPVGVEGDTISVRHSDGSYTFLEVFKKDSFENLLNSIIATESKIQEQIAFDNQHPVENEEEQ